MSPDRMVSPMLTSSQPIAAAYEGRGSGEE